MLKLLLGHIRREKAAARGHGLGAEEGFVVVNQVEAAAVDFQVAAEKFVLRVLAIGE